MALEVRVFIVINKVDSCSPSVLDKTISTIEYLLKSPGCNKIPLMVETDDDAVLAAQNFVEPRICPIFTISCVEGTNLDKLKKFLNVLPPFMSKTKREDDMQQLPEFRVILLVKFFFIRNQKKSSFQLYEQVDEVYFKKKPGHILAGMLTKFVCNFLSSFAWQYLEIYR
jgi:hypothetical protein